MQLVISRVLSQVVDASVMCSQVSLCLLPLQSCKSELRNPAKAAFCI
jgi:hypothetical protein